ncbi:MAG TPA: protease complex subunit PrcB family protein [Pseudomonadales bacterium]
MTSRATLIMALALCAGCADEAAIEATTVLEYNRCQGVNPGLTRVDYAAVAGIRGGTLLGMTDREGNEAAPDDDVLLVAISRGRQPTPGYGFTLERAYRDGATAVVRVRWETPEPGAVLPQTLTHPCLVVALPHDAFQRVEAVDQRGEGIGSLELQPASPSR